MHEKTPTAKNGANFISMSNSKEKHPEIAMCITFTAFIIWGMWFGTQIPMSRVLLPTVF